MNIERPLVNAIILVYKGDRYVAKAIESILDRTYANYEIIQIQ